MALVVRIDVDRPHGKHPVWRHVCSRVASDLYLPRTNAFGYLRELRSLLDLLRKHMARALVFFRRCTLPSPLILSQLEREGHVIGLHLEDSRSFESFLSEKETLEPPIG